MPGWGEGNPEQEPVERRKSPRVPSSALKSLKSARITAGKEIRLINVSRDGALLESDSRVIPGARVCLRLVSTKGVLLVRGHVLRSRALTLRGSSIIYECAVSFDEEFPLFPGAPTRPDALDEAGAAFAAGEPSVPADAQDETDELMVTVAVPAPDSEISDVLSEGDAQSRG